MNSLYENTARKGGEDEYLSNISIHVQVLLLIPGISENNLRTIFTTPHSIVIPTMSWDEMEDLLCSMEMILSFRWDVADVSKTTLTIIICKIDSLLTEIFKNSVCQDIFGAEEVEKIVRTCHMDIFENIQLCLLNTNTVFEKYFR